MKNNKEKNIIIGILIIVITILLAIIFLIHTNKPKLETNTNIKINKNLEYVYDATYSYDNKYTEFNKKSYDNLNKTLTITHFGIEVEYTKGIQYLKNLKIPYININTYDAGQVNKELEQLYIESAKLFDSCAEAAKEQHDSCSQILTYRTYIYENILSIVVIESSQSTAPWVLKYKTYSFDLTTGTKLSYNETLTKTNYELAKTANKIEELLKEKMDSLYSDNIKDLTTACGTVDNKINCYEKANELLKESIENNTILYFIDNFGNLNVLAIPYYDGAQDGHRNHYLITITKNQNN